VGIDISGHAGASLHRGLGERLAPSPALVALGASGRLGKKGGRGFYRYEGGKERGVDEGVYADLGPTVGARRSMDAERIESRLVMQMINEAARTLEDGIVASAEDLDLAMIMGTGFPPFRGGLLRYADTMRPADLLEEAQRLRDSCGDRFEPAPLLETLAKENRGFYETFGRGAAVR